MSGFIKSETMISYHHHFKIAMIYFFKGVAIVPKSINIGRLERTETNLMHFKCEVT